jgi:hypothetical protein
MIELPEGYGPGNVSHEWIDNGFLQRGPFGAKTERINRKGNRSIAAFSFGPFTPDVARQFVGKLIAGKTQGIRLPYPLQVDQGGAGSPVVDGAGQQGTSLDITGLIPGYVCKAGYWLSIESATGQHFLHNVQTGGMANASGELTVTLAPELRAAFADGDKVHLTKPMIEGWVDGETWAWETNVNHATPINFTVEEAE